MFQQLQQVPTFFTPGNPTKENLPSWTKLPLKNFSGTIKYCAGVIMGNYLIVLTQGTKSNSMFYGLSRKEELSTTILALNLLDHSVQEAEMDTPSLVSQESYFSFLKYNENQIIKYGGETNSSVTLLTIESFEPLKLNCEDIGDSKERKFSKHTAQIYQDCLYIYGNVGQPSYNQKANKELWSFDIKNRTWKSCETTGEGPTEIQDAPHSFIFQDNLYIYGVVGKSPQPTPFSYMMPDFKHLYMLNLGSMEWVQIEQQQKYLEPKDESHGPRCCGTIYRDHLVTLKNPTAANKNGICFLNLHKKNSWATFNIEGIHEHYANSSVITGGLMTFKNSVLSLTTTDYGKNLLVAMLNLSNFGISAPKSAEEEYVSSLFMSQEKSDITFKVQDQLIPAHKEILLKKSKYFAGLFNSNMAESKQDVIEITDCEYETFKEYLQFIYQETVNIPNENFAIKLYILADKYLQEDLREKCINFLISIISMENIYTILDFAHEKNLPQVKTECGKCFQNKLTIQNVTGLIRYVDRQEDLEWKENNKEFKNQAFKFVLYHFLPIEKEEKKFLALRKFHFEEYRNGQDFRSCDFLGSCSSIP